MPGFYKRRERAREREAEAVEELAEAQVTNEASSFFKKKKPKTLPTIYYGNV